jgi:hypothetical protein
MRFSSFETSVAVALPVKVDVPLVKPRLRISKVKPRYPVKIIFDSQVSVIPLKSSVFFYTVHILGYKAP